MTSQWIADRSRRRPSNGPSNFQTLKAFILLGALPLAAIAYLCVELTLTLAPDTAHQASPVASERTFIPQMPAASPALHLLKAPLSPETTSAQRASDPVGRYVASLGIPAASVDYTIVSGDTLVGIFAKLKVATGEAQGVVAALKGADALDDLRMVPGRHVKVRLGGAMEPADPRPLLSVSVDIDPAHNVEIKRDVAGGYDAAVVEEKLTPHVMLAHGVIDSSLAGAAEDQGVPDSIIAKFASIYAYDVDFQRDIQPNDTFDIYYTEYENAEGETDATRGEILFARLSLNDKVKSRYRYTSLDGQTTDYYDMHGKSARTFLMRTPVDGARISSPFGMRMHPILGYTRMHQGVDFAAPVGTKIYAAGAGVIERAGRNGGYGNFIEIKHANGYETEYGHLSRYAQGIKPGVHVTQGEVIGYVGSTGLSTGPHLHYGILVNHKFVNPLGVKIPTGTQLAGADLDRFEAQVERIETAMKDAPQNQLASVAGPSAAQAR